MMQRITNAQRAEIARFLANNRAELRFGLITSYDPATGNAVANIMPEEVLTGWLPILHPMIGASFGVYCGPSIKDQCLVAHVEGDRNVGIILGFLSSDNDIPPVVNSGEIVAQSKFNCSLTMTKDGKVAITSNSDLNITVGGDVNFAVTGKVTASATEFDLTGDLKVTGAITATKEGTFNGGHTVSAHKHGGVSTGAGQTGTPTG